MKRINAKVLSEKLGYDKDRTNKVLGSIIHKIVSYLDDYYEAYPEEKGKYPNWGESDTFIKKYPDLYNALEEGNPFNNLVKLADNIVEYCDYGKDIRKLSTLLIESYFDYNKNEKGYDMLFKRLHIEKENNEKFIYVTEAELLKKGFKIKREYEIPRLPIHSGSFWKVYGTSFHSGIDFSISGGTKWYVEANTTLVLEKENCELNFAMQYIKPRIITADRMVLDYDQDDVHFEITLKK